jgi:hypothetical protein
MKDAASRFFEHLASKNVFVDTAEKTLAALSPEKLEEFLVECCELLPLANRSDALTVFDFTVNAELAGAPFPCSERACRMDNLEELARFAALYANSVVLPNPLASGPHDPPIESDQTLTDTFHLLYFLRPLMEAGVVVFAPRPPHFCPDCLANRGDQANAEFVRALETTANTLLQRYSPQVSYTLQDTGGDYVLEAKGPTRLIRHGASCRYFSDVPAKIRDRLAQAPGRKVELDAEEMKWCLLSLISPIIDDIYTQHWLTDTFRCQYLTNRELDLDVIEAIRRPDRVERGGVLASNFDHPLPFIDNVPLSSLLRLRAKEGEAFRVYRDALTKALDSTPSLSSASIPELFSDTVRPELNKIDVLLRSSRSGLRGLLGRDFIVGVGTIALGLFLGDAIGTVVAGAGGALLKPWIDSLREPSELRKEKYYFLWRVRQLAKRHEGETCAR